MKSTSMSRTQNPIIASFDRYLASFDEPGERRNSHGTRPTAQPTKGDPYSDDGDTVSLAERGLTEAAKVSPDSSGDRAALDLVTSHLNGDENSPACFMFFSIAPAHGIQLILGDKLVYF